MSIIEIEAAISQLPASEVSELMTWLERYHEQTWDKQIAADLEAGQFDALISEAYASGEPSPLTKTDIDEARRMSRTKTYGLSFARGGRRPKVSI